MFLWRHRNGFARNCFAAVAILCIALAGYAALATTWHNDAPDRDCPICQIAHMPMVKPSAAIQIAPNVFVKRQAPAAVPLQELAAALTCCSPRAPPALV